MRSLPDEVIIAIFQNLAVPDVFQLALTDRRLAAIAVTYSKSIAPLAARNSFPDAHLLTHTSCSVQDFEWLKGLVPRFIATVLVDKFRLRSPHMYLDDYGIPAEVEDGEELRGQIVQGLRVLNRLSVISKDVYRIPEGSIPRRPLHERAWGFVKQHERRDSMYRALDLLRRREQLVLERRLEYIVGLDAQSLENYRLMYAFLFQPFLVNHDPHTASSVSCWGSGPREPHGPDDFDWSGDDGRRLFRGDSWLNWYILHEGPLLFWNQWYYCHNGNLIKDKALNAWNTRNAKQVCVERNALIGLEATLKSTGPIYYRDLSHLPALRSYRRKKTHLLRGNRYECKEVLNHVPYWVNFRDSHNRAHWRGDP
ncbi:hypothetical protein DL769_009193 [Monosporascus sp. CRB-8-3]|nr:hypothetical protein DL769_009193 [Monosporascus sp. CRB-8-3]